ncbi:arylformamidase [Alkalicoccus saliphilus]|uniref:Kynurenine formamidase n=1 Tax=Alkalicoccus saliphilus TaxID=200989 RepID=A0A2T4U4M4_9BACI|nr:arylformamidase [Alkalicoccus saliphilus]PTL38352.1 arylformamidase [Alkalicoccus saliphilus]
MNVCDESRPWIDISQPLNEKTAHWPGDTPFSYETALTKEETGSVNIGRMTTSLHSGTHADAPFHVNDRGAGILDLDLHAFLGLARIVDVSNASVLDEKLFRTLDLDGTARLLLKTSVPNRPERFPEAVPALTEDGALFLAELGLKLLGVDVPSIDPLDSREVQAHHTLFETGTAVLENLMLDDLPDGDYELIALPLPLQGADGSPVRAVVRPLPNEKGD